MIELQADVWSLPADAHVITTNGTVRRDGACVMGRGCAREARDKFPGIDTELGREIRRHGNRVHALGSWVTDPDCNGKWNEYFVIAFPVKYTWGELANLELIERSAKELVLLVDAKRFKRVVVPRPGCGCGRLQWSAVKPVIEPLLDNRFVVVHK